MQVMAVAKALTMHEDAVLEAEASNPREGAKAAEMGLDPLWAPDRRAQTAAAFAAAPRFILLDFRCAASSHDILFRLSIQYAFQYWARRLVGLCLFLEVELQPLLLGLGRFGLWVIHFHV